MKKLTIVFVGLIVAGCATTAQLDNIEKRLARIEGDIYKIEIKSASNQEKKDTGRKFVLSEDVEKKVVDAKIDSFLKEYLGVQFGDSIDKFPEEMEIASFTNLGAIPVPKPRVIPVLKNFKYFDKAYGYFFEGKLYSVNFYVDIEEKYSIDSINPKIDQSIADLAVSLGLVSTAFNGNIPSRDKSNHSSYYFNRFWKDNSSVRGVAIRPMRMLEAVPNGFRRYGVGISDNNLRHRLEANVRRKANAEGETLPDPE